jgi:hypothetical protein
MKTIVYAPATGDPLMDVLDDLSMIVLDMVLDLAERGEQPHPWGSVITTPPERKVH